MFPFSSFIVLEHNTYSVMFSLLVHLCKSTRWYTKSVLDVTQSGVLSLKGPFVIERPFHFVIFKL